MAKAVIMLAASPHTNKKNYRRIVVNIFFRWCLLYLFFLCAFVGAQMADAQICKYTNLN
jgi:hypothetical protein